MFEETRSTSSIQLPPVAVLRESRKRLDVFLDQLKLFCFDIKSGALGLVANTHMDPVWFMFEDQY